MAYPFLPILSVKIHFNQEILLWKCFGESLTELSPFALYFIPCLIPSGQCIAFLYICLCVLCQRYKGKKTVTFHFWIPKLAICVYTYIHICACIYTWTYDTHMNVWGLSRKYLVMYYEKERHLLMQLQDNRNIVHRTVMPQSHSK